MKVLDLQCGYLHVFEGWFASEMEYLGQVGRGLVACPVCGDLSISKRPSAPRLNLGTKRNELSRSSAGDENPESSEAVQNDWISLARQILANTDDVGTKFAEEARKIHYGETKPRAIRGHATREETKLMHEEGIAVMQFSLPEVLKRTLQ
jgi:hypothetical protein